MARRDEIPLQPYDLLEEFQDRLENNDEEGIKVLTQLSDLI